MQYRWSISFVSIMGLSNKKIVFYLKNLNMGGAQLLIVRLATKFVEMGYEAAVIGIFSDETISEDLKKANVRLVTIDDWDNDKSARKVIRKECADSYVLTMNWQDYCRIVHLKGCTDSVLFYAVHKNDVVNKDKKKKIDLIDDVKEQPIIEGGKKKKKKGKEKKKKENLNNDTTNSKSDGNVTEKEQLKNGNKN